MAEQIISPGVFTRENDLSFLPQGIGAIGAAIIGPTEKGPAFVPTVVRSFADFERRFGPLSAETYVPQTVREYLKNAGSVTVCRVLAGGGYIYADGTNETIALVASGSDGNVFLGAIFPSKYNDGTPDLGLSTLDGDISPAISGNFSITLKGLTGGTQATTGQQFSASLNPAGRNYLFKQLGNNPNNSKTAANAYDGTPGYTYVNFKSLQTSIQNATTQEVATITIGATSDTIIVTSSLQDVDLHASGAFYLTTENNVQHTVGFNTEELAAASSQLSGSLTEVTLTDAALDGGITASQLASNLRTTINSIQGFTASVESNVVTITSTQPGDIVDITTTFSSNLTASVTLYDLLKSIPSICFFLFFVKIIKKLPFPLTLQNQE